MFNLSKFRLGKASKRQWNDRLRRAKNQRNRRSLLQSLEPRRMLATDVSGTLTEDTTWSGTIHVTGDVTVPEGIQLTIDPDTVVKFADGQFLSALGSVDALGTLTQPIVFTSELDDSVGEDLSDGVDGTPAAGDWEAIYVLTANWNSSNTEIRFAGDFASAALYVDFASPDVGQDTASIQSMTIDASSARGIFVQAGNPAFSEVSIVGSDSHAIEQTLASEPTYQGITATGNAGGDHVQIPGGTLTEDRTWDFGGLPLHLTADLGIRNDVDSNPATLTVAPGSVIKVDTGRFISANPGILKAEGTAESPIIFTSFADDSVGGDSNADGDATAPVPGGWESIYLWSDESELTNVEVRYAGARGAPDSGNDVGAVEIRGADPTLDDVLITDSNFIGIDLESGNPTFRDVLIADSDSLAIRQAFAADPTYERVTANNNAGGDHVRLTGGTLNTDRTWDFGELPVHLVGDVTISNDAESNPATLTVAPGSVVKIDAGRFVSANPGILKAEGTADSPIIFTSIFDDSVGGDSNADGDPTSPVPGDWESIYLWSDESVLSNVEVRYAGSRSRPNVNNDVGAIEIRGANPTLDGVLITESNFIGIEVDSGSPTFRDVVINNSDAFAVRQAFAADPTYTNVTARDNAGGDHVQLFGGTLNTDRTWDFSGLPVHLIGAVAVSGNSEGLATLTIVPGSVIKVEESHQISAAPGIIKAEGTPDSPIVFTSIEDDSVGGDSNADGDATTPVPGGWESIYLWSDESVLSNVEVRYAGARSRPNVNNDVAAIQVGANANPSLTNVRVSDSNFIGIDIASGRPTFQNVVITDSDSIAVRQAFAADPTYDGVSARGNVGGDHVQLAGGILNNDRTWDFGGLPVHLINDFTVAGNSEGLATLTIVPGSVIKVIPPLPLVTTVIRPASD
ncbi:MAG: hypothetical protein AAF664_09650, partial [Planctomycetota bacterium]